ncbi:hypothetical protein STRIP9103_05288, partial [Streptomyces ipomoeae 91-03]
TIKTPRAGRKLYGIPESGTPQLPSGEAKLPSREAD